MDDIQYLTAFMRMLIALIAISIALIAFRSYLKFPNRRLLFLSSAFLLLAIPSIIGSLLYSGIVPGLYDWYINHPSYWAIYTGIASIISFSLLAYVYLGEKRNQAIGITRAQWIAGGLLLLTEVGFIIYVVVLNISSPSDLGSSGFFSYLNFLLGNVAYVLVIFTIISLFSYYRAKRTRNTLVVMVGFVCLLLSQAIGVFGFLILYLPRHYGFTPESTALVTLIELVGFIAFLLALVRPRFLR